MFSSLHLADTTRLMGLGHPLPYIFLALPFLYLFTLAPATCLFRSSGDLLTSNKLLSDPRLDPRFPLGVLAGAFVLLQSNTASVVYLCFGLLFSAFAHRPL